MDWYQSIFELIDMRSFSNLWFWIALAVTWSSVSHRVLGVPWDMATRARKAARRRGPDDPETDAERDFEDMVRIATGRILFIAEQSGTLLTGFLGFVLTTLCLLGFVYRNEFAQALFLLGLPLSLVGLLSVGSARVIRDRALSGEALFLRMYRHRMITQVIGTFAIFATAMWGMLQNMSINPLSG